MKKSKKQDENTSLKPTVASAPPVGALLKNYAETGIGGRPAPGYIEEGKAVFELHAAPAESAAPKNDAEVGIGGRPMPGNVNVSACTML